MIMEICDVDHLKMGTTNLVKVYAGSVLVWPCYDCTVEDPEYADEFYSTAVLYVPKVCIPTQDWAPYIVKDAWPNLELPLEAGYNGMWSVDSANQTFGFNAPDAPRYDQTIVEEDSLWLTGFGRDIECSVSFFITSDEVGLDCDGLLFNVDGLEISLNGYEFFNPAIKARALRSGLFFPIEVVAIENLPDGDEVHVIVTYEDNDALTRLRIYYDNVMVGEYLV